MRAAVARLRLGPMTEPIPFWEDWRFWQIVTTGALAFLGFTFGTWIKYWFDLRRNDRLRWQETEALMKALASEMQAIATSARARAQTLNQFVHNPLPSVLQVLEPPRAPVFERNADKIGWIPDAPRDQIFAAIIAREAVEAVIHMYVTGPADHEISRDACASIVDLFETLAGAADEAAKVLREAKVP